MKQAIALFIVSCLLATSVLLHSQQNKQQAVEPPKLAVLISATESYHYVTEVQYYNGVPYTNRYAQADGMVIEYVSPSDGLESVTRGTALGQGLAFYMNKGMRLQPQPVYGLYLLTN